MENQEVLGKFSLSSMYFNTQYFFCQEFLGTFQKLSKIVIQIKHFKIY